MKNKKSETDLSDKSIKQNSMVLNGESPSKKTAVGPEEFEEDLIMDIRMKAQHFTKPEKEEQEKRNEQK